MATPQKPTRLQDPRDIKALAHPARMSIIDALASGDELTATECATLTGLSPSATAYHLKLLERYGFVERAAGRGDGRDRPWRAADRDAAFVLDPSTPAGAAAASAVASAYFEGTREVAEAFIATERYEPEEWRVASMSNVDVWLNAEESRELFTALEAVISPYRGRSKAARPEGARRVRVMNVLSPHVRL